MGEGERLFDPLLDEEEDVLNWLAIFFTYALITLQWLIALTVGIIVGSHPEIPQFVHTGPGLAVCIISLILCCAVYCLLLKRPAADIACRTPLFVIWYISLAILVGLFCSISGIGVVALEGIILISVASIFITLYSLVAPYLRSEREASNLREPGILGTLLVVSFYVVNQIVHPMAHLAISLVGCFVAMCFCGNLLLIGHQFGRQHDVISDVVVHYIGFLSIVKRMSRNTSVLVSMEEGGSSHPRLENHNTGNCAGLIQACFGNNDQSKWAELIPTYVLTTLQWLLCLGVGIYSVSHPEIPQFIKNDLGGGFIYAICIIIYFVVSSPFIKADEDSSNISCLCLLFMIWYILTPLCVGLFCSLSEERGIVVLEALILLCAAAIFITLSLLLIGRLLAGGCLWLNLPLVGVFFAICLYIYIQIFHPFADLMSSVYACAAPIGFCLGLMIYTEETEEGNVLPVPVITVKSHLLGTIGVYIALVGNLDILQND